MTITTCRLSITLILLSLLLMSARLSAESGGLAFVRERIEIEVIETQRGGYGIHVRGFYHFHNFSDQEVERRIFYPFPLDKKSSYPEKVLINYSGRPGGAIDVIPYTRLQKGVAFILTAGPDSERVVEVNYTQMLEGSRAVYITTTTTAWVKPLERAEFIVSVPEALRIKEMSYPPDRVMKRDGMTDYIADFVEFMPTEDLTLSWENSLETPGANVMRKPGTRSE